MYGGRVMEKSLDKIRVAFFDTKDYEKDFFLKTASAAEFVDYGFSFDFYKDNLTLTTLPLAANHEAVCIYINDRIDDKMVQTLYDSGVRLLALRSAGTSNVNLKAAQGKIKVVYLPEYQAHSVAEFSVALLQTFNRKIQKTFVPECEDNIFFGNILGSELFEKRVGIVGAGRIGKIAAQIFKGYGAEVYLNDPVQDLDFAKSNGMTYANTEEIFRTCDYVALYCPLVPETRNIINNHSISLMKKSAVIVSIGRSALIDYQALHSALSAGRIRGAAIEAFEEDSIFEEDFEQNSEDEKNFSSLVQLPNVLMTKHQAVLTSESLKFAAKTTLKNILEYFQASGK